MNTIIKNSALAILGLAALLAADFAAAQPDRETMGLAREQCPPACGVRIVVPRSPSQEPGSAPETLEVDAGQTVTFVTNVAARVIFTGKTPFIDERGNKVFNFRVDDSGEIQLRVADSNECSVEPGCKYMIIDATNPGRPARDPYIIVRR